MTGAEILGPAWARAGLAEHDGRFPLAVEAPVMATVGTLVPGVTTQTRWARYYGLYWAVADRAERGDLDAGACRDLVRGAELLLAAVSLRHDDPSTPRSHGVDRLVRGGEPDDLWALEATYSPRAWGFFGQYGGSCTTLGMITSVERTLRPGRHPCPSGVVDAFAPLLDAATARPPVTPGLLDGLGHLAMSRDGDDLAALRPRFAGARPGEEAVPADHVRRATLRIVLRARALSDPEGYWVPAVRTVLAYGDRVATDAVLAAEAQTAVWRGVLLRHHSVGAWRRLWARLVEHVETAPGPVTRTVLHEWITGALPDVPLRAFREALPPTLDPAGHPAPAEELLLDGATVSDDVGLLLLGARRLDDLPAGTTEREAFLARRRGEFLDPRWVASRLDDVGDARLATLGRALVDDMLAQARRVALRKMTVRDGRLRLFSRLHERDGRYVARSREGAGNVSTRISELVDLSAQLGLADRYGTPSDEGRALLGLPA